MTRHTAVRPPRSTWMAAVVLLGAMALMAQPAQAGYSCDGYVASNPGIEYDGRTVTCSFFWLRGPMGEGFRLPQTAVRPTVIAVGAPGEPGNPGRFLYEGRCVSGGSGGPGGPGARVTGPLDAPPGSDITVHTGQDYARGGGSGGYGETSSAIWPSYCPDADQAGGNGGDGGGASYVTGENGLLVVAGGGGGGGGGGVCECSPGGFGGFAGMAGAATFGSTAGQPGITAGWGDEGGAGRESAASIYSYVGGGGGGGGGLRGGGGGLGGWSDGGSGGGGGTSLVPEGGTLGHQSPSRDAYVDISWVYDLRPPTTDFWQAQPPTASGWNPDWVQVVVTASDTASGVRETRCVVDPATAPGHFDDLPPWSCNLTSALSPAGLIVTEGVHEIYAASVDNFGRVEPVRRHTVRIDRTAPTVTATVTAAPGASGWYRDDVTVHFTCADAGSGIAEGACPADQMLTAEAPDVRSTAVQVTDGAGNVSAPSNVVQVKIDKTGPTVLRSLSGTEGDHGWYLSDLTVDWNWRDAGSGIVDAACTPTSVTEGEGAAVTVSASCRDVAGNPTTASGAFKIDRTPPADDPRVTGTTGDDGWYRSAVEVTWGWDDATSGVYHCPDRTTSSGEGDAVSVGSTCRDMAGNLAFDERSFKIDFTPPSAGPDLLGTPGESGWYVSDVAVDWNWADGVSGIDAGGCLQRSASAEEGVAVKLTSACRDLAGNPASAERELKVDKTPPEPTPEVSGTEGDDGWYVSDIAVNWHWTDTTSGIEDAACIHRSATVEEGDALVLASECRDVAGNAAGRDRTVKIDKTAPTLASAVSPDPLFLGATGASAAPNAADGGSGLASAGCGAIDTASAGDHAVDCRAVDQAGLVAQTTHHYTVLYRILGLDPPRDELRTRRIMPVAVELADAAGRPIPDAEAGALAEACVVTFGVEGAQRLEPECLTYDPDGDKFVYRWRVGKEPGAATMRVEVRYPGATNPAANARRRDIVVVG